MQKQRIKNKKIRFGIIGCSRVAKKYFLPALLVSKKAELKIIGSRKLKRAKEYADEFKCENHGNYDDVLNSGIDAVYISLPIGLHEKWVIESAKAGKHVICEKSSTTSYKSAKKMTNVCKKQNVRLLEGFAYKFHPQHDKIKELVNIGKIGQISTFTGFFGFPSPPPNDIRWDKELGGGVLNDAGCYPISASTMIFNDLPIGVMAKQEINKKKSIDIGINIMMSYPKNKVSYITARFENYFQSKYFIWGTKGTLSTNRAFAIPKKFQVSVFLGQNDIIKRIKFPYIDQTKIMIDKFSEEITDVKKCDFNFETDLLIQAKIMDAIRKSSNENRFIKLKL